MLFPRISFQSFTVCFVIPHLPFLKILHVVLLYQHVYYTVLGRFYTAVMFYPHLCSSVRILRSQLSVFHFCCPFLSPFCLLRFYPCFPMWPWFHWRRRPICCFSVMLSSLSSFALTALRFPRLWMPVVLLLLNCSLPLSLLVLYLPLSSLRPLLSHSRLVGLFSVVCHSSFFTYIVRLLCGGSSVVRALLPCGISRLHAVHISGQFPPPSFLLWNRA